MRHPTALTHHQPSSTRHAPSTTLCGRVVKRACRGGGGGWWVVGEGDSVVHRSAGCLHSRTAAESTRTSRTPCTSQVPSLLYGVRQGQNLALTGLLRSKSFGSGSRVTMRLPSHTLSGEPRARPASVSRTALTRRPLCVRLSPPPPRCTPRTRAVSFSPLLSRPRALYMLHAYVHIYVCIYIYSYIYIYMQIY